MQGAKEKLSNMASAANEHVDIYKAKAQEKAEKETARTKGEKEIAEERRKMKEAEAKAELHAAKAEHKAERENAKHSHLVGAGALHHGHGHAHPVGTVAPNTTATAVPTNPLAGHPPTAKYL